MDGLHPKSLQWSTCYTKQVWYRNHYCFRVSRHITKGKTLRCVHRILYDVGNQGTGEQGNRGTGEPGNRGTGEQGNRGTGEQGNRGNRGTGELRNRGTRKPGNEETGEQGNCTLYPKYTVQRENPTSLPILGQLYL